MEKNPYLTIMIQSLKKKSAVLDAIIELNIRQKEELEKEIYSLKHELIGVQMKLDARLEKDK